MQQLTLRLSGLVVFVQLEGILAFRGRSITQTSLNYVKFIKLVKC